MEHWPAVNNILVFQIVLQYLSYIYDIHILQMIKRYCKPTKIYQSYIIYSSKIVSFYIKSLVWHKMKTFYCGITLYVMVPVYITAGLNLLWHNTIRFFRLFRLRPADGNTLVDPVISFHIIFRKNLFNVDFPKTFYTPNQC